MPGNIVIHRKRTQIKVNTITIMPTIIEKKSGSEFVELIEIEKKSLELSEANTQLFARMLEAKRSPARENLVLSILALNFLCSVIAL